MKRLDRLIQVLRKRRRVVVGVSSGPVLAGVDVALVEIEGGGKSSQVRTLAFRSFPFPAKLRQRILRLLDPESARFDELSQLDFFVGELFAAAVERLLEEASFSTASIDLIGAAGQTIWSDPEPVVLEVEVEWVGELLMTRSALCIGQSAVIAERTGALTVGDLRVRDIAAGGQGTPLMAYADWVLLRHPKRARWVQNLDGEGFATYLPPAAERRDVLAVDTGPGYAVIEALGAMAAEGEGCGNGAGRLTASGEVREDLLHFWRAEPLFTRSCPGTTARARFGAQLARQAVAASPEVPMADLVATAAAMTAEGVGEAYRRLVLHRGPVHEVVVGGGGARDLTLMEMLRQQMGEVSVVPCEERGIDSQAKEAIGVAIIANDALQGLENNLTGATGGRGTVLGKVSL